MLTAVTFAIALVVALTVTPIVRGLAISRGYLDHPGGRKIHSVPIPRVGGVAMVVAFGVAIGIAALAYPALDRFGGATEHRLAAILSGSAVLAVVGIVDDIGGMRALVKLAAQVAAAVVAWQLGLRVEVLHVPWDDVALGALSLPLTVLWIVAVINAVNLIDGLDGLASAVVITALGAFAVLAAGDGIDPAVIIIAATIGAAMGFLAYNLHPASIIMGDTGSMFLGFVVAAVAIAITQDGPKPVAPWVPIIALALPIADTAWAIIRRSARGGSVFEPDRGHIHHQLLHAGLSQRDAMLILTALSAAVAVVAIVLGRLTR